MSRLVRAYRHWRRNSDERRWIVELRKMNRDKKC